VDEWVFRMLQEERRSNSSHFVTLTYDSFSIPISPNGYRTLKKKDFQDFMKRLRMMANFDGIKYYAVGEYGEKNLRPHYHAIIFNCKTAVSYQSAWSLPKSKWMAKYDPGYDPYPDLDSEERISLGTVHVGTVSGDSIAYTVKYLDKKRRKVKHSREDFKTEFSLMSKRLGDNYLSPGVLAYHRSRPGEFFVVRDGGHKVAMPRYYRDRIWIEDHEKERNLHIVHDAMLDIEKDEKDWCKRNGKNYAMLKRGQVKSRKAHFDKYNSKKRRL
jgi:hypothetical protein